MLTKEQAIEKLRRQIVAIEAISRLPRFSPEFKKWQRDTEVAIENIFGSGTRHLGDFERIGYSLSTYSSSTPPSRHVERFQTGLQDARSILASLVDEIEEYWVEKSDGQRPAATTRVERLCDRFHLVARKLRVRHGNRPTLEIDDEHDAQDLLHALLVIDFDDVRREEWTPSYAGGSARMDFLLKQESLVIELKKTRKTLGPREVGDELLIDIGRYQSHPDCKMLVCFVYDPEGRIGNPAGLESDLSRQHDNVAVRVIVAPKGL